MSRASKIVKWSRGGRLRLHLAQVLLVFLFGLDIPPEREVGHDVEFLHNGIGTVIHPKAVLKDGFASARTLPLAMRPIGRAMKALEVSMAWLLERAR